MLSRRQVLRRTTKRVSSPASSGHILNNPIQVIKYLKDSFEASDTTLIATLLPQLSILHFTVCIQCLFTCWQSDDHHCAISSPRETLFYLGILLSTDEIYLGLHDKSSVESACCCSSISLKLPLRTLSASVSVSPVTIATDLSPPVPLSRKRSITFHEENSVVYIPSLQEYFESGLSMDELWWTYEEFEQFRQESEKELDQLDGDDSEHDNSQRFSLKPESSLDSFKYKSLLL